MIPSLPLRHFLVHCADVGDWSIDDPISVAEETIQEAVDTGLVLTEKWRNRFSGAQLTARGRSVVTWFLRHPVERIPVTPAFQRK